MVGGAAQVVVVGFGTVGVIVYARNAKEARVACHLAALLYAVEEEGRRGRARAS